MKEYITPEYEIELFEISVSVFTNSTFESSGNDFDEGEGEF